MFLVSLCCVSNDLIPLIDRNTLSKHFFFAQQDFKIPSRLSSKLRVTMALGRKMKIFGGILTFVGLILVTVSFVSPGWINVTIKESSYDVQSIKRIVETYFSAGLWYFSICKHYSLPSYVVDLNTGQFRSLFSSPQDACEVDTYTNSQVTPITEIFLSKFVCFRTLFSKCISEKHCLSSIMMFKTVVYFQL